MLAQTRTDPSLPWFGVRVRSNCEQIAASALEGKGYTSFLPSYQQTKRWSDRTKRTEVPLFPGYVFCRFDPSQRLPVLMSPGVVGIVGVGKEPAPINEQEIEQVRAVVASGIAAQPCPFTREGDHVSVCEGPLRGVEGVVTKVGGEDRLIISITMLQRSVSCEVQRDWVRNVVQLPN